MPYQMARNIAKYMDKYYIDPILNLILPAGMGAISSIFVFPFIYLSAVKIRSLPLTLAVIYNVLIDALIGLIPFLGNVFDFFHKAYVKNARLINGFIEDDKEIIGEVNRKAIWMGILIAVVCYLIYLMVLLVMKVAEWIGSAWDWFVGLF